MAYMVRRAPRRLELRPALNVRIAKAGWTSSVLTATELSTASADEIAPLGSQLWRAGGHSFAPSLRGPTSTA
ncbi:hypothetical protein [Streptomyces sp. AK02-04a]|uniref:hypothetical protein n=1 Tax=Streptomyces sp. AK02-04a TaxID=3028649 RepID=UPI0029AF5083|nr:hypothetical protein [Streptomyces sp. AK02-04a]MDX3762255.1 hypothetical protein [Streptomyces sp. AK02-04a]